MPGIAAYRLNIFVFFVCGEKKYNLSEEVRAYMAIQEVETAEGKIYSRIIKHQSARENNSAMASKTNTTLILSGAFVLIMIVCGSVAVAR